MTIAFTRLFTTQGLIAGALNEANAYRGTTLTARRDDLVTQLATALDVYQDIATTPYANLTGAQSAENGYVSSLSTLALSALLADVEADRAGAGASLPTAADELVRQMRISGDSLNACPGAVAVSDVGTPAGDHQFVFDVYEPATGKVSDFVVPDVYLIRCTADRSTGGTAFAESFSVVGKTADAASTDAQYPSGTGINTTVTAVDPAADESVVQNGGFDTWSTNTPGDWTVYAGAAGTNVFQKGSDDPRGTAADNKSLRLVSTGSLVKLRQAIAVSAGQKFTAHARLKKVADPGTDWAVSLILTDSTGATLAGNGAYSNVLSSAAAGSLTGDWANVIKGAFCVPDVLPADGLVYLEIRFHQSGALTTAPANTAECYVDHVSLIASDSPLYDGGPTLVCFSGRTEAVVGDTRTAAATITGTLSSYLIRQMDRLLGLASLSVRIPTDGSGGETILDSLVT